MMQLKVCFDLFQMIWMGEPDLHVFLCLGSVCSGKYIGWNGGGNCLFLALFEI